ncbi:MAG TPA: DUF3828 domain-containing protein [Pyrinomonadaceae bacterium]|jgi:hypothetical protein|nr:DUF3828 domain-containing protein [Pyrinomonadaceae bacterium]
MKRNLSTAALLALFCIALGSASVCVAQTAAPATVVRNLYTEHKAHRGPFFQSKSRALVDKFFTKEFADVIWKDRVKAGKDAGYLDFDPLYDAQDVHIKNLKFGKAEPGEGNLKVSHVPVTFNNMGNATTTVLFHLIQGKGGVWKIDDILYPGDEAMPSVKEHLQKYVGK